MIQNIRKRDGRIENFDKDKIINALQEFAPFELDVKRSKENIEKKIKECE